MSKSIYPSELYVDPESFSDHFAYHWHEAFGNAVSDAMRHTWRALAIHFNRALLKADPAATTFNESVAKHKRLSLKAYQRQIIGIPAECGAGKTQSAYLYLANLANNLDYHCDAAAWDQEDQYTPGAIYLTRTVAQAHEAVSTINSHYLSMDPEREPCATAFVSQAALDDFAETNGDCVIAPTTPEETQAFPVLVMCSEGFVNTIERSDRGQERYKNRWQALSMWARGHRRLIIIDEALKNTLDHYAVEAGEIDEALSSVHPEIRQQHPREVRVLRAVDACLARMAKVRKERKENTDSVHEFDLVPEDVFKQPDDDKADFEALLKTLKTNWKSYPPRSEYDRKRRGRTQRIIKQVAGLINQVIYYHIEGSSKGLNASRLLLPVAYLPIGYVLLDATLKTSDLATALGKDKLEQVSALKRVRSFKNFKLNVSRTAGGTGKRQMNKKGQREERIQLLFDWMDQNFDKPVPGTKGRRRVLVVAHKDVAAAIENKAADEATGQRREVERIDKKSGCMVKTIRRTAKRIERPYELQVGWYNNITGKNNWRDFDTVVIFTTFYQRTTHHLNMLLQFRGVEQTLRDQSLILRRSLTNKTAAAEAIQAMLRIKARQVRDESGNCEPCEAYVLLGDRGNADDIERMICEHLDKTKPDGEWNFKLKEKLEGIQKVLFDYMMRSQRGLDHSLDESLSRLQFTKSECLTLRRDVTESDRALRKELLDKGFRIWTKRGRGGGTFYSRPVRATDLGFKKEQGSK